MTFDGIKQIIYSIRSFISTIIYNIDQHDDSLIFLFGNKYDTDKYDSFLESFHEIILFSYRYNFPTIRSEWDFSIETGSSVTTDLGWGCMLRVIQMSLALGLLRYCKMKKYTYSLDYILQNFQDLEESLFSIHQFVKVGCSIFNKKPKDWFGPTSASTIADYLVKNNPFLFNNFRISSILFKDGTIYKGNLFESFKSEGYSENTLTFVWLCTRLGSSALNIQKYKHSIFSIFKNVPQLICIAGGHNCSSSALLIVGASEKFLYCLDPHIKLQEAFVIKNFNREEFIQQVPMRISWENLNPSLSFVFCCTDIDDFNHLCYSLVNIDPQLFEILPNKIKKPNWTERRDRDNDFIVI
ncbi:peptidase family C54 [Cryptosporidium andersoni]|uniref:Cysteine protease n=1 Tax=Cryptosporidium andersoni TaxID=117008 RepID=A0A1J4MU33_9CRYT|nr:peptidase family C54 [Cryptosporidium andersoni]